MLVVGFAAVGRAGIVIGGGGVLDDSSRTVLVTMGGVVNELALGFLKTLGLALTGLSERPVSLVRWIFVEWVRRRTRPASDRGGSGGGLVSLLLLEVWVAHEWGLPPASASKRGAPGDPLTPYARQHLVAIGGEEGVLIRPDLIDVQLVEPGVRVSSDRGDVALDIRATGRFGCERVFGDEGTRLLKVLSGRIWASSPGSPSLGHSRATSSRDRASSSPQRTFRPPCTSLPFSVRDRNSATESPSGPTRSSRLQSARRARPTCARTLRLRSAVNSPVVIDAGMLDAVVVASVIADVSTPERADHVNRFLEHLQPLVGSWPAIPEDVLV